ncbi:MAG TPA: efflux RND transporter periplasmic adaptor subunit [Blastocatellia bacterium]
MKRKFVVPGTVVGILVLAVAVFVGVGGLKRKAPAPPPMNPPEVEVVQVEQRDVPVFSDWIGTLDGFVDADVKAQVQGYLLTKNFTEGSVVKKGQLLFQIDPRPFEAAVAQAKAQLAQAQGQLAQANSNLLQAQAQLAQAQANEGKTLLDVNRYTPLAKERAITQEQLVDAVQADKAAKAQTAASSAGVETARSQIEAAKAAVQASEAIVKTAELNLGFTKITSPLEGIVGIAAAQVGDLVNPSASALTTVSTVDPIKVYFTVSEQEYLKYTGLAATQKDQQTAINRLQLELILADGTVYAHKGKFYIADREVNTQTGSLRMAGLFPNPGGALRPGQYGRVRAVTDTVDQALLVPQRAVTDLQGMHQVAVVGNDNKVAIRTVKVGQTTGSMWVIQEGLNPGEKVVAEGTQKVRPDMIVDPKPYTEPASAGK